MTITEYADFGCPYCVARGTSFVAFRGSSAPSSLYADLGFADLPQRLESALR